jgi:hypothetical protein
MKKTFILLSLLVLALSANVFAQKQMTAKQLFMSLPSEYVSGTAKQRAELLVFPKSIKANFLSFGIWENSVPKTISGDFKEPFGGGVLRVFRGTSSTIVGLRYQIGDRNEVNPTTDTVKITTVLLEYKGGKWTNVTEAMMPKVSTDYAYKVLTEDFQEKDVKKEDVWVEFQIDNYHTGIVTAARRKGNDSITTLKFFKWNGTNFVEAENK